ncbi:M23 family metallopeptidase [Thiofilum flexile]|uniref:M23 family metallopeptidase n=1 Tax=Thiofilum flexile TaxID=125627 RepID=UPI000374D0B6|nr:M23 family metallopeptidase [Thiofilum flexile]
MFKWLLGFVLAFLVGTYYLPETSPRVIPVAGAKAKDWNPQSFWYYPWGRSRTHKGIDIFATKGTPVLASTSGWVWKTGYDSMGGNYVLVIGAKWRFHYFAHLDTVQITGGRWVSAGTRLGTVGDSGNAQGKAPHLHYQIHNLIPDLALADDAPDGHLKPYYTNPGAFLQSALTKY